MPEKKIYTKYLKIRAVLEKKNDLQKESERQTGREGERVRGGEGEKERYWSSAFEIILQPKTSESNGQAELDFV